LSRALRAWRQEYAGGFPTPEGIGSLVKLLCANESNLRAACARVRALSYAQMKTLAEQHPGEGLTEPSVGVDPDYAEQVLDRVCKREDIDIHDADRVEVLKRVLDYAKFV
jgi:hypothetical protein